MVSVGTDGGLVDFYADYAFHGLLQKEVNRNDALVVPCLSLSLVEWVILICKLRGMQTKIHLIWYVFRS